MPCFSVNTLEISRRGYFAVGNKEVVYIFTACDLFATEFNGGLIKLLVEVSNRKVLRPGLVIGRCW